MLKKWFHRITRIASGTFGLAKEDGLSFEASLTKFERFVHFWVLVWRSFVRNRCPVRASALSYTTLVAMIPMLAVVMSITSALLRSEGEDSIKQFIERFVDNVVPAAVGKTDSASVEASPTPAVPSLTNFSNLATEASNRLDAIQLDAEQFRAAYARAEQQESNAAPVVVLGLTNHFAAGTNHEAAAAAAAGIVQAKKNVARDAANYIYEFAKRSYSGTLGVTGMIFLVLTAILTLTRVEETFNDIWGVTRGRDWWSRITNYTFTIAFGPALLIAALGLANSPNFQKTRDLIVIVPVLKPLLSTYLPVILICFTFAMFYKLVPNTKVDFSAALVGGSLAGCAWHFYNHLGFLLASRWLSANAIYGGLAIIPLLMGGLYVVWLTVLFGAQVAYAFQNRASYLQDRLVENVNQRGREFVALRLMTCIGQRFHGGLPPATIREISVELGIPSKLVQQVMRTLLAAQLVIEVSGAEAGYSPARPLDTINCHQILIAMRATHGQEPATRDEPVRVEVLGEFARIQAAEENAAAGVSMLALVNRAQARLQLAASAEVLGAIPVAATAIEAIPAQKESTPLPGAPAVSFSENAAPIPPTVVKEVAANPAVTENLPRKSVTSNPPLAANAGSEDETFPL